MKRFKPILLSLVMIAGLGFGLQAQIPEWTAPETVTIFDAFSPEAINLQAIKARIEYPAEAIDTWVEGRVVMRVLVDEKGQYVRHEVLASPHALLSEAVVAHLPNLQFKPAHLEGTPLKAWVNIPFDFKITE